MARDLLIRDKDYEKALGELGFCTISLLSSEQIEAIRSLYEQFAIDNKVSGLIASHSTTSRDESLHISHSIRDIMLPSLEKAFQNYEFFIAGFMVKEGNASSEFPLHQDWNILDESEYTSYQIWVPLDLSHPANGGMFVLSGSHRFFPNYRSGTYGLPVVDTDDSLKPLIADMIIPPGDVLVYHNSLFHASYPNRTNTNRIAVIVSIHQKNAPLRYFQKNPEQNRTDTYAIDASVFLSSLSRLEKGGLPEPLSDEQTLALNPIDNSKISSADLVGKFKSLWGEDQLAFEPTQLHLLKDRDIEKKMQREGYVILDLLDDTTLSELMAEYNKLFLSSHTDIGRFSPMEHATPETKRYTHNLIVEKTKTALDRYFKDYHAAIATYFTKFAHSEGDLGWHTDTSLLLNTQLEPHYAIWCPLIDVHEKNGALCVVERSHKFSHVIFLKDLQWPYTSHDSLFNQKKKILQLKAGQMVLFDIRLVHNATPNSTDEDRVCCLLRLTHKKSNYYSFTREDQNSKVISVLRENQDFYLKDEWKHDNREKNPSNKIGEMQEIHARIDHRAIAASLTSL